MSFDLSSVPAKSDLPAIPEAPVLSDADVYANKLKELNARLSRLLNSVDNIPFTVFVDFLTPEDKTALDTALQAKGYTCVASESGEFMTVE